ncbi:MAG: UDP-galactopyranose mutase, partial [Pyrinomonadaceae bacterium]
MPTVRKNCDLLCFTHLRWDFVYQRPQHLMSRFAKDGRVFFIEEPIYHDGASEMKISHRGENLFVVVPHLQNGKDANRIDSQMSRMIDNLIADYDINEFITWYYTPMMLRWSGHLSPTAVIYDAMDELSAFKNAPRELIELEAELFSLGDLVFTGGQSLY